jgi:DNA-binding MarR family transcriptional regulator
MRMPRDAVALASLLEQTSRCLHSLGYAEDLFPAQWTALRYFARAEAQHRTASALARFQGLAAGPVTRTVRTLVSKGLLEAVRVSGRGGPKQLDPTERAHDLLARDPLIRVMAACSELTPEDRGSFASSLGHVLGRLQGGEG